MEEIFSRRRWKEIYRHCKSKMAREHANLLSNSNCSSVKKINKKKTQGNKRENRTFVYGRFINLGNDSLIYHICPSNRLALFAIKQHELKKHTLNALILRLINPQWGVQRQSQWEGLRPKQFVQIHLLKIGTQILSYELIAQAKSLATQTHTQTPKSIPENRFRTSHLISETIPLDKEIKIKLHSNYNKIITRVQV